MIRIIVLFFFVIATQEMFCQNIKIIGKVYGSANEAIIGVNILDVNSKTGTITDEFGHFELIIKNVSDTIQITHVAYETIHYTLTVDSISNEDSLIFLEFILVQKNNILNEIEIKRKKENLVLAASNIWIYDFELYDSNKVFIILDDTLKNELRLLDIYSNTLDKINFNTKLLNLHKDCFNNTYVEVYDTLYQINSVKNKIYFESKVTKSFYLNNIEKCKVATDSILVFNQFSKNNQLLTYYYINRKNKNDNLLYIIFNEENYINTKDIQKIQKKHANINYLGELSPEELKNSRSYFEWSCYFDKIASKPIYCPIVYNNDSIYLFDFYNGKLVLFNQEGNLIRKNIIKFQSILKILNIVVDVMDNEIYVISIKNGEVSLNRIDLNTGELYSTFTIHNHLFPQKIKIRDGYVYFIDQDYNGKLKLFKYQIL